MAQRVILAVLVAPLAAVIPLVLLALLEPLVLPNLNYGLWGWSIVSLFAVPIAYAATICIGVPSFYLLRRSSGSSVVNLVLVGFLVSLVPSAFIWFSSPSGDDRIYPMLYILCAVAVSLAFGVILGRVPSINAGGRGAT